MPGQTKRKSTKEPEVDVRSIPRVRVVVEATLFDNEEIILDRPAAIEDLPVIRDEMLTSDRERFICIHLDAKNRVLSWELVSVGSLMAAIVHPRELFKAAILANAASVVLCHNHPSGDATPSGADIQLTRRLAKAGDVIGIEVLDHLVITGKACISFRDLGLL